MDPHVQRFLDAIDKLAEVESNLRRLPTYYGGDWLDLYGKHWLDLREQERRARVDLDNTREALYALQNNGCIRLGRVAVTRFDF